MGFFDAARVPPPPPPPSYRLPEWIAPPENYEPGEAHIDAVLARTDEVVLSIALLKAFPTGVSFELACAGARRAGHPFFGGPPLIEGGLGFGVLLADGRTAIANEFSWRRPVLERPPSPVLRAVSGGSNGAGWRTLFWLWPLPSLGPLEFVVDWALEGIPETGVTIDGAVVTAAAVRARELWPDRRDLPPTEGDVVI